MAKFYSARSKTISPLPWLTFVLPFSAVTGGGYAVHQLADELYLDGFLTFGVGRNDLEMANDVLALTSDYTTRTATAGAALSGVYEYEQYEFRPELAFSYGKTWIGTVGFTGRAYGLVDNTLSMDAGTVSIANLTLRPEVIWALDADTVAASNSQLSFAPRLICESTITTTRTENCGGGAELGLISVSEDGLSTAEFRVFMDRVGTAHVQALRSTLNTGSKYHSRELKGRPLGRPFCFNFFIFEA